MPRPQTLLRQSTLVHCLPVPHAHTVEERMAQPTVSVDLNTTMSIPRVINVDTNPRTELQLRTSF